METFLFDRFAENEDRHWWFRGRREVLMSVLDRHLARAPESGPRHLLDVGCGTGFMLEAMRRFGEVEGLETSPEARDYCRRRVPDVTLYDIPLPEGLPHGRRYDAITAFDVIEHIEDPRPSLEAISRALAPGGTFICTVPAFSFLWSRHDDVNHHFRRYTRGSLVEELRRAGLRVEFTSYFNAWLFAPVAAVRLAQKLIPERGSGSDMDTPPPMPINETLTRLFASEKHVVPTLGLPFGVSLLAVAKRA
ncbi:MAG: class I SAM-dependent DNA methyltransferase [Myxococcaceae bacterium]